MANAAQPGAHADAAALDWGHLLDWPGPPSIREEYQPRIEALPVDILEADRLAISFPLGEEPAVLRDDWRIPAGKEGDYGPYGREKVGFRVPMEGSTKCSLKVFTYYVRFKGAYYAWLEVNPSRLRNPDGVGGWPLADVRGAVARMWAEAEKYLVPAVPPEGARVRRVDIARDFLGVRSPATTITGLSHAKRSGDIERHRVYVDCYEGVATGLVIALKAEQVRLYDAHARHRARGAPRGMVRMETQARENWLNWAGVPTVGDLDPEPLARLAAHKWAWGMMGSEVCGPADIVIYVERAVERGLVTKRQAPGLFAWLQAGHQSPLFVPGTTLVNTYRRAQRALGVICDPEMRSRDVRRLDILQGREVIRRM